MNARVSLQPVFVLHNRYYGDSSLILEALTRDYGRVSLLAKGYRKKPGNTLQVLAELLVSWSGRGELKTLTAVESPKASSNLAGRQLYAALYVNELLMRLLPKHDAHPQVFACYQTLLSQLASQEDFEPVLREFELHLLADLGYALNLSADAVNAEPLQSESVYRYVNEEGFFLLIGNNSEGSKGDHFLGVDILAIAAGDYTKLETRRAAKRLMRLALAPLLGTKPLKSRELFAQVSTLK